MNSIATTNTKDQSGNIAGGNIVQGDLTDQHITANTINIFVSNETSRTPNSIQTISQAIPVATFAEVSVLLTAIGNLSDDIYLLLTPDRKVAYGSPHFWRNIGCEDDKKTDKITSLKHLHRACTPHLCDVSNAQKNISQTYAFKSWRTFSVSHKINKNSYSCTSLPLMDKKVFLGVLVHCKPEKT